MPWKESLSIEAFRQMVDSAPNALVMTNQAGEILLVNALAEKYFGYARDELAGTSIEILIPERFRRQHQKLRDGYMDAPESRPMGAGRELYGLRRDGTEFPIEIGLNPVETDDGRMVVVAIVDISARKREEELFRLAVQQAADGLFIVDNDGKIQMANRAAERCFGYLPDELLGKTVDCLVPAQFRSGHPAHRQAFLAQPEARPMGMGRDLFATRKDGSEFPVEIGLNPLQTSQGTETLVVVVDITNRKEIERERKRFETRLQQTQKLESLGVLAGGIAHDFNNVLTGVLGNAELALSSLPESMPARFNIERIIKAAVQASELCAQMLAYSGRGRFVNEILDLNQVIQETTELLHISTSKSTSLRYALTTGLPTIEGDRTQIRQIVMNLVINGSEAVAERNGTVTVSTGLSRGGSVQPADASFGELAPDDDYVWMTVTDTGHGISKDLVERIFDPFFSTKFTGRGLGLAAVLGIVRSHRGVIRVKSELGQGATFTVLLPVSSARTDSATGDGSDSLEGPPSPGRLLVVDDEEFVRTVLGDTLRRAGYHVVTASDGEEGLAVFESGKDHLDLVILDLTMPRMSGDEVYRRMHEARPELPVIVISGFSQEELSARFAGAGVARFVAKPFRPSAFLRQVEAVLAESRTEPWIE